MPTFAFNLGNGTDEQTGIFVNVIAEAEGATPRAALTKIIGSANDSSGAIPTQDCWPFEDLAAKAAAQEVTLYAFFSLIEHDYEKEPDVVYFGHHGEDPGDVVVVSSDGEPRRMSVLDFGREYADKPNLVAKVDLLEPGESCSWNALVSGDTCSTTRVLKL